MNDQTKEIQVSENTGLSSQNPSKLLELAINKDLDLDKLKQLMDMQAEWERREAEKAYNNAMSRVQKEIKAVQARLTNNQTRSKYAGIVDIDAAVRPAYTENGIALSFDTADSPLPEHVRILAFVTHESGHKETRHIDIPADGKGAKGGDVMTKTHAVMSATTYGQRALTKMIFNIASGEFDDDDGNGASLSKEEIQELQKSKLVELVSELEEDLTEAEKTRLDQIIKKNEVASYSKAIKILKEKEEARKKRKQKEALKPNAK